MWITVVCLGHSCFVVCGSTTAIVSFIICGRAQSSMYVLVSYADFF